jgi:hypothetical protein
MRLFLASLLLLGTLSLPVTAHACQCGTPPPVADAFRQAPVVALVRVTRIDDNWTLWRKFKDWVRGSPAFDPDTWYSTYGFRVTLQVLQQWKGLPTSTLVVVTGRATGDCGLPFELGETYLLFPRRQSDGRLAVSICGRHSKAQYAGPDVQALDAITHAMQP